MGDAVRAANAYLPLSRFEGQRSRTLVAREELVVRSTWSRVSRALFSFQVERSARSIPDMEGWPWPPRARSLHRLRELDLGSLRWNKLCSHASVADRDARNRHLSAIGRCLYSLPGSRS